MPRLPQVLRVVAGHLHSCALVAPEGSVACWGDNTSSQLDVPQGLRGVVGLTAGLLHSCAVVAAGEPGRLVCWGDNHYKQRQPPHSLVAPVLLTSAGRTHTCAATSSGAICFGDRYYGQCDVPPGLGPVSALAAGYKHSCAIQAGAVLPAAATNAAAGVVVCWGGNELGQLDVPAKVLRSAATAVAAGKFHSCVISADGGVACWGDNSQGQCNVPEGLGGVVDIAVNQANSCALTASGKVLCWGSSRDGQLSVPPL
jgi:alpha-tubulin suppressor-like RCC1 family protein